MHKSKKNNLILSPPQNHHQHKQQISTSQHKNVINSLSSLMNFLPDNRPITSLQIVEDYEKCPKNFSPINRTYDQDADADLWREKILIGRPTLRYLCISKTEGLPEYVLETLKIISEKDSPPQEFSLLSRTADSEQKAWRKKQIAYKLSKRGNVANAITDIILCSKLKSAPEGFKLAGEINGILICFKTGAIPIRLPPPIPPNTNSVNNIVSTEVEKALNRLRLNNKANAPLPPVPNNYDHDYEEILTSYKSSSNRPAPSLPQDKQLHYTLGAYTEVDGVTFTLNPNLAEGTKTLQNFLKDMNSKFTEPTLIDDYDFQLERQILCTMKSSNSTNPFFK